MINMNSDGCINDREAAQCVCGATCAIHIDDDDIDDNNESGRMLV